MIPSLKILDFNSKGILQLYPLWNPIIIAGGGKKKDHAAKIDLCDEVLIFP